MQFKSSTEAQDSQAFRGQGAELRGQRCASPSLGLFGPRLPPPRPHWALTGAAAPQASDPSVDTNPSPDSPRPQKAQGRSGFQHCRRGLSSRSAGPLSRSHLTPATASLAPPPGRLRLPALTSAPCRLLPTLRSRRPVLQKKVRICF